MSFMHIYITNISHSYVDILFTYLQHCMKDLEW